MNKLLVILTLFLSGFAHSTEVEWSSRLEGNDISNGSMFVEDGDFSALNTLSFVDSRAFSYLRLGLNERVLMDHDDNALGRTIKVNLLITPFDDNGSALTDVITSLSMEYSAHTDNYILDASDYRMDDVHRFSVKITGILVDGVLLDPLIDVLPNYVYLQGGFYAERYYKLDVLSPPTIGAQMIEYSSTGALNVETSTIATSSITDEIFLNWTYVDGAEYYDLEWTWVDNYSDAGIGSPQSASSMEFSDLDFKRNSTRIRTTDQQYRLPQVFSKGYLIYRVRGVGRWLDDTQKDLYGNWSSGVGATHVSNWNYVTITEEHEQLKNWQYQATYAEDGKKKEVVQYFDGSLRGRQTVTRINSDNHSVVGETVYDNEGRGVIQILPVPQDNPAIRYYPSLNEAYNGSQNVPYSHRNFDWEDATTPECAVVEADPLITGAADYYSTTGYDGATDQDWQKYVPESNGYPFTQVEYTPDNTGRIRNQSGVGNQHKIGSEHETYYYYLQPSQSELDRLFGYKVGYKSRYKKNMVVDANGQVSVSYLDAQGRVIATAMAGDNNTKFNSLESEQNGNHVNSFTDLLNKMNSDDVDTDLDDNTPFSTSRFGVLEDGLEMSSQIGVVDDPTQYDFQYTVTPYVYQEQCDEIGVSYPYVYDLRLSVFDDCGQEMLDDTIRTIGLYDIGETINSVVETVPNALISLDQGSYTVHKSLIINEEALAGYKADYLSDENACLLDSSYFLPEIESEPCPTSCEACIDELGIDLEAFKQLWVIDSLGDNATVGSLLGSDAYYGNIYTQRKEDCLQGCEPNFSCDAYHGMLFGDVSLGGQYGGTNTGDYGVFTNGKWRHSDFFDNALPADANNYNDENGNGVLIEAYPIDPPISISGAGVNEYQLIDNGLTPLMVEPWQLKLSDFRASFESSWSEALIKYHPEYPLYEYATAICIESFNIPTSTGTIPVSSELFDAMLRDQITDYNLASINNYDIDFLVAAQSPTEPHPLYHDDPFFHIAYPEQTGYTLLRNQLMEEALEIDYKNTGMTMLEYAIVTAMDGNNVSSIPSSNLPSSLDWSGVASLSSSSDQDLVWGKYKFYYLSYKGEINQLLMDFYGFSQSTPIFNGCIGPDALSSGIVQSFSHSSFYLSTIVPSLTALWFPSGVPNFPMSLCATQFDSKIIRIVRMDALFDPGLSAQQNILNLSTDTDYAQWEQTGLCPLTADIEVLLNDMGTQGQLKSAATISQANINSFVPDLYEAFSGTPISGATSNMTLHGTVVGSNLELSFSAATGMTAPATLLITAPDNNTSVPLNWSQYNIATGGTWDIYSIDQSYVVPLGINNATMVVITAGPTLATAQEYIATYTILGAQSVFTDCQALQNPANDPACTTEEQLEADLLNVIQARILDGTFTATTNITNTAEFVGTTLSDVIGASGIVYWNPPNVNTVFSVGDINNELTFAMNFSFPSGNFIVTGVDLQINNAVNTIGNVTLSIVNSSGLMSNISGIYSYQQDHIKPVALIVDCPCEDETLEPEAELLSLLSVFFNDMITVGETPANYQPSSYLALNAYSPSNDLYTLYIDADGSSTSANFSVNYEFAYGGMMVSISPGNNTTLVSMTDFVYANGNLQATAHFSDEQSEVVVISLGDLVSFEGITILCDDCLPVLQQPISCTDAYVDFNTKMELIYDVASITPDELLVYEAEHEIDEETFCGSSYAYITSAYINYLNNVQWTSPGEQNYLTISEFGSTPFGYSNTLLDPIVVLYDNSSASDPSNSTSYMTWNEFAANYFNSVSPAICPATMGGPYFNIPEMVETPCAQWQNNVNIVNMQNQQTIYLEQMGDAFVQAYIEGAMSSVKETFTETHEDKEYHYTLYYYDRAGNLVQTVPPKGVDRFEYTPNGSSPTPLSSNAGTPATFDQINNYRTSNPASTDLEDGSILVNGSTTLAQLAPTHTHETQYRYNSLNQLVYQHTPDGGESRFAYDKLGRLVMSQNAKQKNVHQFSYTIYDELGRVSEVGELTTLPNIVEINEMGRIIYSGGSVGFDVNTLDWINQSPAYNYQVTAREEVTRTIYDELDGITSPYNAGTLVIPSTATTQIQGLFGANYAADNTRNRIVGVVYQDQYNSSTDNYESATFYDYDVHGNVKELLQVNTFEELVKRNQHIKRTEYDYDLVSGNVNKVTYQKEQEDQFIHRYHYDSDNRITITETSKDGIVFEKDAKYFYYDHGPLARTEIGEDKVQSLDYAYTIQGWLKTVNGEEVDHNMMMGQDGKQSTLNSQGGRDAFGFSLSYFDDDYASAETQMLNYATSLNDPITSLYNGNIRAMQTALIDVDENMGSYTGNQGPLKTHQTQYGYDQLNRINTMSGAYRDILQLQVASGYSSSYSFDENGNLQTLERYANDGTNSILMDDFDYNYGDPINDGFNNRLTSVDDQANSGGVSQFGNADLSEAMLTDNYDYDAIGQLIKDDAENIINIEWKVTNKVEEVQIDTDNDLVVDKFIHFDYDPMGNRIAKHVTKDSEKTSTFYILDAQGNPMSIYTYRSTDTKYELTERSLYGSSRVGMETPNQELSFRTLNQTATQSAYYSTLNYTGDKSYELSNHLGNVLEVITDRKLPIESTTLLGRTDYHTADVIAFNDYYPYGMIMPNRTGTQGTSDDYRYGFQGKEADDEIKGTKNSYDFGARLYDSRVGRWFARDPKQPKYPGWSPYNFVMNSPLSAIDPDGEDVIILYYATGNQGHQGHDDAMFKASAETRKNNIESSKKFNSVEDIVVLVPYERVDEIKALTADVITDYSGTYGKTTEIGIWSHSGTNGPIGAQATKENSLYDETNILEDSWQMTLDGWEEVDFNWSDSKDDECVARIYGCFSAYKGGKSGENFAMSASKLSNFDDVKVWGQQKGSFPSIYVDQREYTNDMSNGKFSTVKEVYMVGSDGGPGDYFFNEAYKMTGAKNGTKLTPEYQPGTKEP